MFPSSILPLLPVHPAMLLVLLPSVGPGAKQQTALARTTTNLLLKDLQIELGGAIRVLKVDEASHPGVHGRARLRAAARRRRAVAPAGPAQRRADGGPAAEQAA
jgi:hypothetical protein